MTSHSPPRCLMVAVVLTPFPVEAPPAASRGPGVAGGSAAREGGTGLGAEGAQDSVLRCWWRFAGVGLSRRAGEAAGRGERTAEGGGGDRCGRARAGSGGALGRSGGRHPARSEEVRAGGRVLAFFLAEAAQPRLAAQLRSPRVSWATGGCWGVKRGPGGCGETWPNRRAKGCARVVG